MDRRGHGRWWEHKRWIEFCPKCNTTCTFELHDDHMVCIGDQRTQRVGCGVKLPILTSRMYGDCLTCHQVRRAFKVPGGEYYCCYCLRLVTNVSEFKDKP